MNFREQIEEIEQATLSKYAVLSKNTKGRKLKSEPCPFRTEFQRDRDKIVHCKSFRRLKHKTQVFLSPEGDHYRTRLTHTLEVSQIARTISRALRLNEDLTEAIALGHDLGHTPFGHIGENALNEICPHNFYHYEQSLRIVDILENTVGLNLCYEVRDGIVNHTGSHMASTLEGRVIKYADRIAYINHDIDDAIRAGVLRESDLPKECTDILGKSHSSRIDKMVSDICTSSYDKNSIKMSPEIQAATDKLRTFMFENVYLSRACRKEEDKAKKIISELYSYFCENPDRMPDEYKVFLDREPVSRIACDYIACMSDRFAVKLFSNLTIPSFWSIN